MKLTAFTKEDFEHLYEFMHPLWHETYGEILPKEQIDFLLDKYFSKDGIAYYLSQGYEYYKLDDIGVLVYVQREADVYMDKLYLLPEGRGKGYPMYAFNHMSSFGKDVRLSVNQANKRAFRCYQKNGFVIEKDVEVVLENGMINHDYIMIRRQYK